MLLVKRRWLAVKSQVPAAAVRNRAVDGDNIMFLHDLIVMSNVGIAPWFSS
jgi:hypothetical protein